MISARSFKRPRTPRTVEIAYRYQEKDVGVRPRPPDATTALSRLIDGNRAFADLLDSVKDEGTSARRVVQVARVI